MSFDYHEPESLDEVVGLLAEHGSDARVLAGGTAFVLMYRLGLLRPSVVIGLAKVESLNTVEVRPSGLWIGAGSSLREVERSSIVASHAPVLNDAFRRIATVRIRNQGTVGGNLCHADPAQDPPPVLIGVNAVAHIAGPGGRRRSVPIESFCTDFYTSDLGHDEVLVGVSVPSPPPGSTSVYERFVPRTCDDYPTVSVAATVGTDEEGAVRHVRVGLGGVGPTPIRAVGVEAALMGRRLDRDVIEEAAHGVREGVDPMGDIRGSAEYKRDMAEVWVRRALVRLANSRRVEAGR